MAGTREDVSDEFYYLRFFPKNMEESAALLDYNVFPVPFDAEVVSPGYLNRETDGGAPSYYCLVRTDRELPNVEYEIINTLMLVRQTDGAATNYFTPEQWQNKCEYERQNKDDNGRYPELRGAPQKYGFRFTVQDNFIDKKIGIPGIEVMVRGSFGITTVFTDENGRIFLQPYIQTSEGLSFTLVFRDGVDNNWRIVDESLNTISLGFSILTPASYDNEIELDLAEVNAVQRALYRFFKNNSDFGVTPLSFLMNIQYLQDKVAEEPNGLFYGAQSNFGKNSIMIKIWGKNSKNDIECRPAYMIFRSMSHELGHYAHWRVSDINTYRATESILKESWSRAVEKVFTEKEYGDLLGTPYTFDNTESLYIRDYNNPSGPKYGPTAYNIPDSHNCQAWPYFKENIPITNESNLRFLPYSPLFIDLMDESNQAIYFLNKMYPSYKYRRYPNDVIRDYTIHEMGISLSRSTTLAQFRDDLKTWPKSTYRGNSHVKLDTLFNRYIHFWTLHKKDFEKL